MILAVVGPTGVGKTKMSIELAKKYDAIIINCDATQIYKGLDIGSAKVTEEEKEGVPHFLFDYKNVDEPYSIYDYQKDVRVLLKTYKNKNIVFVGGTGLYLKAALYDYDLEEEKIKKDFSKFTNQELYKMVCEIDSENKIHPNNRIRLERFLNKEGRAIRPAKLLYPFLAIGLTTDRDRLYDIINRRVDKMFDVGLVDEVRSFYEKKIYTKPLLNGIGYKELYSYFDGDMTLNEALEKIKQNSRHYAKRQYTFFKHQLPVTWFSVDYENFDNTINEVVDYIEKQK